MPLITGGIGDAIAVLQHCPNKLPSSLYLATARSGEIGELCYYLGIDIKVIESHRTYHMLSEVEAVHGCIDTEDWSISRIFPFIMEGKWKFERSLFSAHRLPRKIKEDYVIVNPGSMNYVPGRDLTNEELNFIFHHTEHKIVVLNKGQMKLPKHERVLDLTNYLNMMESIAIALHAKAYFGVDSWLACVCSTAKLPCFIKSVNPQYYFYRKAYCSEPDDNIKIMPYLK